MKIYIKNERFAKAIWKRTAPQKSLSESEIHQYNISFSTVSAYEKTRRCIIFDDFIVVIAVLIFISIMSIIINLLWRFKFKNSCLFIFRTTAAVRCMILFLFIFNERSKYFFNRFSLTFLSPTEKNNTTRSLF